MHRIVRNAILLPLALVSLAACAIRLGGPRPVDYDAVALEAAADQQPADVAQRIRDAEAELVLLSADRDSAWFSAVAAASGLMLSGPGTTPGSGLAFLSNLEILGDTSLVLEVGGGGAVHMHDALYSIDGKRYIDMMAVHVESENLRAAVQTLLGYIATDVPADAAVLLAIEAATPAASDSAALLMRATLNSVRECLPDEAQASAPPRFRLLYGPSARVSCRSARLLPGTPAAAAARLRIGR